MKDVLLFWVVQGVLMVVGTHAENATVLFTDGMKDNQNRTWACVRGAAILQQGSTLLAFSGGGTSCSDGHIGFRILLRTSTDDGETWTNATAVAGDDHTVGGYIAPIVDQKMGKVILLYNRRFVETWQTSSTDKGITWTEPVNITDAIGVVSVGPPGGVQLASGRLVIAGHGANGTFALYSDNGGENWTQGKNISFPVGVGNGGESSLVDDGRSPTSLAMTIRVNTKDVLVNHAISYSDDGGETWSNASAVTSARGPTCQGGIGHRKDGGGLLISWPNYPRWRYPEDRKNMLVPVAGQQIFAGPSAYSAVSADGRWVMFEGGASYRYASVMIARVNITAPLPL
eukprot:gene1225-15381_t